MLLPLAKLLPTAISLVEIAGKILSSNKKKISKTENTNLLNPPNLLERIQVLEENELKQAELIQQMALQNLALTKKAESNYRFAIISLVTSSISIILIFILYFIKF